MGSCSVNGVANHSGSENRCPADLPLQPAKFNNKTNGITHDAGCSQSTGATHHRNDHQWITDLDQLQKLNRSRRCGFRKRWAAIKRHNKAALTRHIEEELGSRCSPALFDVQVKRMHEYAAALLIFT